MPSSVASFTLKTAAFLLLCNFQGACNPGRPQTLSLDPDVDFNPSDAGEVNANDDAGIQNDAGFSPLDAGMPTDAGLNLAAPSDACSTYVACLRAIDPTLLEEDFLNAYGPGGICWVNGPEAADYCDVQCRVELTNAQEIADIIPECYFPGLVPDTPDAGVFDAGRLDAGVLDAGVLDAGVLDAGVLDAGVLDAGVLDAGVLDAGVLDAGDAGIPNADAG